MGMQENFLASINENPDDDTPRLIYADWLDDRSEQGDIEHAEFIRVQCESARMSYWKILQRRRLHKRASSLLQEHASAWLNHADSFYYNTGHDDTWLHSRLSASWNPQERCVMFERGFPELLQTPSYGFVGHWQAFFCNLPLIPRLRLTQIDNWSHPQLPSCPYLERVRALDLSNTQISFGTVQELLHSPHLSQLKELNLEYNYIRNDEVDDILATSTLRQLRVLNLRDNRLSRHGMARIREALGASVIS